MDAWGIVPSAYDENGEGGQDVVGKWEREDGLFKLSFRRFKKINDKESGKKLWQFIGTGSTTPMTTPSGMITSFTIGPGKP